MPMVVSTALAIVRTTPTVTETEAVEVALPSVAMSVTGYVPAAVGTAEVVKVTVPVVPVLGCTKAAVSPVGSPEAETVIALVLPELRMKFSGSAAGVAS